MSDIPTRTWKQLSIGLALGIFALVPLGRNVQRGLESLFTSTVNLHLPSALIALSLIGALLYHYWRGVSRAYGIRTTLLHGVLVLTALVIGGLSIVSMVELSHLIIYGTLGFLLWRCLNTLSTGPRVRRVFVWGSLINLADEILQGIHPERFFDLRDLWINTLGISIGLMIAAPDLVARLNEQFREKALDR